MPMTLELTDDLAATLSEEALRRGMAIEDFATSLLTRPKTVAPRLVDGASLAAYLEAEGLLGTRMDISDTLSEARRLRAISNNSIGEL